MELEIRHISGNDLAVHFTCECPSETFKGSPIEHFMKERINLYGYNDNYFFDIVNAQPRKFTCKCGRKYTQQWFKDGYVIVNKYLEN